MRYDEMTDRVTQHTGRSGQQAGTLLAAVMQALRETAGDEAADMQAQLPEQLAQVIPAGQAPTRTLDEFVLRVGELTGASEPEQARAATQAGFSVLAEAISAGQLRQLMHALPEEYGSLAPSVSGLPGEAETLLAEVAQRAKLDTIEQARQLTAAVLGVLSEAVSAGQLDKLADTLPETLAATLRQAGGPAQPTEADRFLREISQRAPASNLDQVRAHTHSVFTALQHWAPAEFADTLAQLPQSITDLAT